MRPAITILIMVLILAFCGCVSTREERSDLVISDIELTKKNVSRNSAGSNVTTVDINVTTYLENRGDATAKNGTVIILARAWNQETGLLDDRSKEELNEEIKPMNTANQTQTLAHLSKDRYKVTVTILEDGINKTSDYRNIDLNNVSS